MKISVQNFGIISNASVEVNGISLIAGANDSGKSTIGKIFYSIVRGFNPEETVFVTEKNEFIRELYQQILRILRDNKAIDITNFQTTKVNEEWTKNVRQIIEKFEGQQKNRLNTYCVLLEKEFNVEFDSISSKIREVSRYFSIEFNDEISPIFNNKKVSRILLEDLEGSTTIEYSYVLDINRNISTFLTNSFFIETPSLINNSLQESILFEERFSREKEAHLKFALANESSFVGFDEKNDKENDEIIKIISKIILGELIIDDFSGVIYKKNGHQVNIDNVALGIKGFGLIQLLLKNKQLNERTLLIIDEPEIHLHPNWQVLYAEILVLLSKKLEIPILLTSHSPYFIEALKAFSEKYNFQSKTNFYFSEKSKDGLTAQIVDVSEDISPILVSISEAHFKISDIENE